MRPYLTATIFVAALFNQFGALAQDGYPAKPVRLVVAAAPGGGTDIIARLVAQGLSNVWKQSVFVENKAGASGNIAGQYIARATPDGYSLLVSPGGSATINPLLFKDMGFDPMRDLTPVTNMATSPMYLAINPTVVPSRSLPDFLAYARTSPVPLAWGSSTGSADALAGQMLGLMANIKLNHIPYKGGAEALLDVLAGRVSFGVFSIAAAMPYVKTGQLVVLGGTQTARSSLLPNVPSIAEAIPGYEATTWYGVWAPAGTPPALVEKINQDIRRVIQGEAVKKRATELGLEIIGNSSPDFTAAIRSELQRHEKIVKALGSTAKN